MFWAFLAGVEITESQFQRIADSLPRQRGNVSMTNLQLLNALLYVVENGCKWRGLPKHFGNWHTIYMRLRRWAEQGVLERVFEALQRQRLIAIRIECLGLDSTSVKVHPDAMGALKKEGRMQSANPEADGTPKFIWSPRMIERR